MLAPASRAPPRCRMRAPRARDVRARSACALSPARPRRPSPRKRRNRAARASRRRRRRDVSLPDAVGHHVVFQRPGRAAANPPDNGARRARDADARRISQGRRRTRRRAATTCAARCWRTSSRPRRSCSPRRAPPTPTERRRRCPTSSASRKIPRAHRAAAPGRRAAREEHRGAEEGARRGQVPLTARRRGVPRVRARILLTNARYRFARRRVRGLGPPP